MGAVWSLNNQLEPIRPIRETLSIDDESVYLVINKVYTPPHNAEREMRTGGERIRYRKRGARQKRGKQNTNKEEKDTDK